MKKSSGIGHLYARKHTAQVLICVFAIGILSASKLHIFQYGVDILSIVNPTDPGLSCHFVKEEQKFRCWQDVIIKQTARTDDLDRSFKILEQLKRTQPLFSESVCHSLTHTIGTAVYKKFSSGAPIKLTPKTTICGYGFFHGVAETATRYGTGDDTVRSFCNVVEAQLANSALASTSCYHGIGHGAVETHDSQYSESQQSLVDFALGTCTTFANTKERWESCAIGVFNGMANILLTHRYNWAVNNTDPFLLCSLQQEHVQKACYIGMVPVIRMFAKDDFATAVGFLTRVEDEVLLEDMLQQLSATVASTNVDVPDFITTTCLRFSENISSACIKGLIGGLWSISESGKEYLAGLAVCRDDRLPEGARELCLGQVLGRSREFYSADALKSVCQSFPDILVRCQQEQFL